VEGRTCCLRNVSSTTHRHFPPPSASSLAFSLLLLPSNSCRCLKTFPRPLKRLQDPIQLVHSTPHRPGRRRIDFISHFEEQAPAEQGEHREEWEDSRGLRVGISRLLVRCDGEGGSVESGSEGIRRVEERRCVFCALLHSPTLLTTGPCSRIAVPPYHNFSRLYWRRGYPFLLSFFSSISFSGH
jgi:hypothetical protein